MYKENFQKRLDFLIADQKKLQGKMAECEAALTQMQANKCAYDGAIAECRFWISEIDNGGMSLSELKTALGADSVEVVSNPS